MKKLAECLLLGVSCSVLLAVNSANAYTYDPNLRIPVMEANVSTTENGTTVTYSRPIIYAGSRMVKRPRYYRDCKRRLGYWDENLCAQIYMPKLIEEKFGDVLE